MPAEPWRRRITTKARYARKDEAHENQRGTVECYFVVFVGVAKASFVVMTPV